MSTDQALRDHLQWLICEGDAHLTFEQAVADLPAEMRGAAAPGIPHTPWRLVEHMRICQWDILEFSRNPTHESPDFPGGYWPDTDAPPSDAAWEASLQGFRDDMQAMQDLVMSDTTDLFVEISHGQGQTILREALLAADHNAYHLGQVVAVRRALGAWPKT